MLGGEHVESLVHVVPAGEFHHGPGASLAGDGVRKRLVFAGALIIIISRRTAVAAAVFHFVVHQKNVGGRTANVLEDVVDAILVQSHRVVVENEPTRVHLGVVHRIRLSVK